MYLSYSFQTWPAYFVFVSTFYSMKELLTAASYQEPSLESFCDSLIREQDKFIHLGITMQMHLGKPYCPNRQKVQAS